MEDKVPVSPLTEAPPVRNTEFSLSLPWLLEQKSHDLWVMGELNDTAYGKMTYKCNSEIIIARYQLSFLSLSH